VRADSLHRAGAVLSESLLALAGRKDVNARQPRAGPGLDPLQTRPAQWPKPTAGLPGGAWSVVAAVGRGWMGAPGGSGCWSSAPAGPVPVSGLEATPLWRPERVEGSGLGAVSREG
jgi:hypothetical protein